MTPSVSCRFLLVTKFGIKTGVFWLMFGCFEFIKSGVELRMMFIL